MVSAEQAARVLGGAKRYSSGWLAFCPAHDNKKTPSLSLRNGNDGRLLYNCFSGCDPKLLKQALQAKGCLAGYASPPKIDRKAQAKREEAQRKAQANIQNYALKIWRESVQICGTPVWTYLTQARGLQLKKAPNSIRFHPHLKHPSGVYGPCMVALITGPDCAPRAIHRTWIRKNGSGKANIEPAKAMLGPALGGGVRFCADKPEMAVAEGIETALSYMQLHRMPCIATLSTSGTKGIELPHKAHAANRIHIAADHDRPGIVAANTLLDRLRMQGRQGRIHAPQIQGADWNDILLEANPCKTSF